MAGVNGGVVFYRMRTLPALQVHAGGRKEVPWH
jgi:hypothetical protein